jgi:hypothetical protein
MKFARPCCVLLLLSLAACGGSGTPTAPTPPPIANIAGNWTGNLSSTNYQQVAINLSLAQSGSSVTGTWVSSIADWNGQITGTTDASSFTGQFTLSAPNALGAGPRCTGTASISGSAGTTTLTWTGAGFTGSCNGEPVGLTFHLQRQ